MESIVGIGCAGDITCVATCFIIVATFPCPIKNDDMTGNVERYSFDLAPDSASNSIILPRRFWGSRSERNTATADESVVLKMLPGPSIAVLAKVCLIHWFCSNITFVGCILNPEGDVYTVGREDRIRLSTCIFLSSNNLIWSVLLTKVVFTMSSNTCCGTVLPFWNLRHEWRE